MTQERMAYIVISALLCLSIGMTVQTWKRGKKAKNMKSFVVMLLVVLSYAVILMLLTFNDEIR